LDSLVEFITLSSSIQYCCANCREDNMTTADPTDDEALIQAKEDEPAVEPAVEPATVSKKKKKKKKKATLAGTEARDAVGRRGSALSNPFLRRRKAKGDRADTSISFQAIQEELDTIPVNNNGEIHEDDLEQFAEKIIRHKRSSGRQRKFLVVSLTVSGLLILALFGMIILAISVSKDTNVDQNGKLIATNKAETPVVVRGNNGVRIHADTTPLHSIPMRRARRLFRRMLSDEDEFEDGDTVALVNRNDIETTYEAVVNYDNGVHVDFEYLGDEFDLKLGTDAMVRTEGIDENGYSIQNLKLDDGEEAHTLSVVCTDGSDECDVVSGSETTNRLVRRLQQDYQLGGNLHRRMETIIHFPETAACTDCGPDQGEYGVCHPDNDEPCSWCECAAFASCTYGTGDELVESYSNYGINTRGSSWDERRNICYDEMFPSDPEEIQKRKNFIRYRNELFNRCSYCECGIYNCNACFSPDSSVQTKDRGTVLMKELQLGDSVLTSSGKYKKVQAFQSYLLPEPEKVTEYLKIMTDVGNEIVMTPRHMIFRCEDRSHPVPASMVREGDCLVVTQQINDESTNQSMALQADVEIEATVTQIEQVPLSGGISPLTEDGTIIVDGIVASCYSNPPGEVGEYVRIFGMTTPIHRHTLTHALFAPVGHFCDRVSSIPCVGFWDGDDPATRPSKMPIDFWFTYFHKKGFTHFLIVMIFLASLRLFFGRARKI
jgi:hypothetical protein